jgi:hypothetical protein
MTRRALPQRDQTSTISQGFKRSTDLAQPEGIETTEATSEKCLGNNAKIVERSDAWIVKPFIRSDQDVGSDVPNS